MLLVDYFCCKRKQWITPRYVCRVNNKFGLHVNNGANDKLVKSNLASDFRIAMEMWLDNIIIRRHSTERFFSLRRAHYYESGARWKKYRHKYRLQMGRHKKVPCDYKHTWKMERTLRFLKVHNGISLALNLLISGSKKAQQSLFITVLHYHLLFLWIDSMCAKSDLSPSIHLSLSLSQFAFKALPLPLNCFRPTDTFRIDVLCFRESNKSQHRCSACHHWRN